MSGPCVGDRMPAPGDSSDAAAAQGTAFRIVIPARYGASRLPGKPLIDIGGRPLVTRVWDCAMASRAAEVVIATDDARIHRVCRGIGAEVMLTRGDHASGSDRIAEVIERRGWGRNDIIVNLQGDEPCMPPRLIDQVAGALIAQGDEHPVSMATLCTPIDDPAVLFDPHVVKVVTDAADLALYFSRAPIPWHREEFRGPKARLPAGTAFRRHIGLYAYRAELLLRFVGWAPAPLEQAEALEQLRVLWQGERIRCPVALEGPGPGVDTADDVARALAWLSRRESP
jgi:3-deoxy-manno-octulosonate cytidylyltransferase (CMP-KDO synthetase)